MAQKNKKPIVLVILDGYGYRPEISYNAVYQAYSPHLDEWINQRPHAIIDAAGTAVGLPKGYIGNSEVGHLTIGAGRVIPQDVLHINESIQNGSFFSNKKLIDNLKELAKKNATLHIMGLISDAGVHSELAHLFAYLKAAHQQGVKKIIVHAFLDGRDVAPRSAKKYLEELEKELKKYGAALGSIQGRFYAMDRDKNWERTEKSYNVLTEKQDIKYKNWDEALEDYYNQNLFDEFIPPTQFDHEDIIKNGDGVIFINFRPDRARQLTQAFTQKDFKAFKTKPLTLSFFITPVDYDQKTLNTTVLFERPVINDTLKDVLNAHNKKMLSVAETEKYAHVTYFFNGMKEQPLSHETRIIIPSIPAKTYVEHPEMSAAKITETVIKELKKGDFDFYLINYANADMVGHSGDFDATVKAIEFLDTQLDKLYNEAVDKQDGTMFLVGDHGNAEEMFDEKTQQPKTSHTTNPVPFMLLNKYDMKDEVLDLNSLADVAPFILSYMGLPVPKEMKK